MVNEKFIRERNFQKMPSKQKTDGEKISEEVLRQSEQCNCYNPYKIQKVGEGHYRVSNLLYCKFHS